MIIGISGLIGSGKDTVANFLIEKGFVKGSFADSLKDSVSAIFGWDRIMLQGDTVESRDWRETVDDWWSIKLGEPTTPRSVLQKFGTDVCRNHFHSDIWIPRYSLPIPRFLRILFNNFHIKIRIP